MSIEFKIDWRMWGLGVVVDFEKPALLGFIIGPLHITVERL